LETGVDGRIKLKWILKIQVVDWIEIVGFMNTAMSLWVK
jgi:hypothetical protein